MIRVLVEDVFRWLKAKAMVLERAFPQGRDKQGDVFRATCRYYNYIRMMRIEQAQEGNQFYADILSSMEE